MNSPVEDRLRKALTSAGASVNTERLKPLVPAPRRRRLDARLVVVAAAVTITGLAAPFALAPGAPDHVVGPGSQDLALSAANLQEALVDSADGPVISVFLCKEYDAFPACRRTTEGGGAGATREQKDAIEKALTAMPGVEKATFEDERTAYERFREAEQNSELLKVVRVDDLPESFRVTMKPGADRHSLISTMREMPGVSNVVDQMCLPKC